MTESEIRQSNRFLQGCMPREILAWATGRFGSSKVGIASSLSAEDQVLAWAISELDPRPAIFTLDTGRLFPQTFDLIDATRERYGLVIEVLSPRAEDVEAMVAEHGVNLFRLSVELRKHCCRVRKVDVLERRLATLSAWVTGLRRQQASTRADLEIVEWDTTHGRVKVNPLVEWSEDALWSHVRDNRIPYNPLHDSGFPSIGCAPCTRAVAPDEDVRAGRWWWEQPEQRECGLHLTEGRLSRARPGNDTDETGLAPEEAGDGSA
jgi:phosphoadenosine phosphosulfate reductase